MNKRVLKQFAQLKSKCKTKGQKKSFNRLVKAFAGVTDKDFIYTMEENYNGADGFSDLHKELTSKFGKDYLYADSESPVMYDEDKINVSSIGGKAKDLNSDWEIATGKFEGCDVALVGVKDAGAGVPKTLIFAKKDLSKLNKYLEASPYYG